MDDNGHGTLLAGIIGSSNPGNPGIAPDVDFVDLKVLDANQNGNWTAIENALQWVITNQAQYHIVAVNLSFGTGNYLGNPYTFLDSEFTALKSLNVFTAVASGNNFYTENSQPGLAFPAVDPNVVSVGATWAGNFGSNTWSSGAADLSSATDQILSVTQRSSALDIIAPGAWITSDGLNNTRTDNGRHVDGHRCRRRRRGADRSSVHRDRPKRAGQPDRCAPAHASDRRQRGG